MTAIANNQMVDCQFQFKHKHNHYFNIFERFKFHLSYAYFDSRIIIFTFCDVCIIETSHANYASGSGESGQQD